jgi:uncharacterized protein (TIGR01777 family)
MPETFTLRSPMPASADDLFAWHARPAAFHRLLPPWEDVRVEGLDGPFGDGQRVTIRSNIVGPVRATWVAELFDVEPGRRFRDRQLHGPFAEWTHTHSMIPTDATSSVLEDHIEYRLPLGPLGKAAGGGLVRGRLARMFAYRHAVTASDLRRLGTFRDRPAVAVTGASGLVGTDLCHFLAAGGYPVKRLVRGEAKPRTDGTAEVTWTPDGKVDPKLFEDVDAVIHLAGDNVADGRWDAGKKARIRDSRVGPTRRLAEAVAKAGRPRVLVSASAIGFYGSRGDEELDETSAAGTGFFADVCRAWESAADPARAAGVRVVHPRIGVVLSAKGGALAKQLPAFRAGGGAVLGDGRQWVPWVMLGDLVGILHHVLMRDDVSGPVNAVGPVPVTNREFGRVLAAVVRRPYLLTLPAPALRLLFGEFADEGLLASLRVLPRRLRESGFGFDHPELGGALCFVLGTKEIYTAS